ncbi:uncharacterized protein YALI1_C02044g [Yarrowia lipolytica]|uniref:Uncharacterized protein n=1 Tax=Yarrowia lipolytica TaxID=4952 RepID=A0A1D8N981_YARLL|nr:hypothetical protein YALI1_C02044g [Yarrowia lipolytica]
MPHRHRPRLRIQNEQKNIDWTNIDGHAIPDHAQLPHIRSFLFSPPPAATDTDKNLKCLITPQDSQT